jgi:WD40 repeat protein
MSTLGEGLGSILRPRRRGVVAAAAAVLLVATIATAGLLVLRGGGPAAGGAASGTATATATGTDLPTPAGTGIVARLPAQYSTFSWAPDGGHLLVASQSGSRVYDRFGKLVSEFGGAEGWLDSGHLVGHDGSVASIDRSQPGAPSPNSWVVANGHGSAAIIVAVPACVGDPLVNWYRDGSYEKAQEKVSPFGWSPEGQLLLKGHLDCSSEDATLHGWKGRVDVVDFVSGRVVATAQGVRGEMAFSPDLTMLAAQSDADLEIVDLGGQPIETLPGTRFLGWLDAETLYAVSGSQLELVDLDPLAVIPVAGDEWQAESPTGLHLAADLTGAARRIVAADGTTLMDLTSAGLVADNYPTAGGHVTPALQQSWWSPDGRMLALESSDGSSLVLISVDPTKPGSI